MKNTFLDSLSPVFRLKAMELLARCVEMRIPVAIINTLRSQEEQEENLIKGVSWPRNSKHLPHPPDGLARAIDIAPYEIFLISGPDKLAWDAKYPAWQVIGLVGESLGLRWGGKWKIPDLGHFEDV